MHHVCDMFCKDLLAHVWCLILENYYIENTFLKYYDAQEHNESSCNTIFYIFRETVVVTPPQHGGDFGKAMIKRNH